MNEKRTLQAVPVAVGDICQSRDTTRWVFVPVVQKPEPEYLAWKRRRRKIKRKAIKALNTLDRFLDKAVATSARLLRKGVMCVGYLTVIFVICRTMRLF